MLKPDYTTRFKKDVQIAQSRNLDSKKLKKLIGLICDEAPLPVEYRDHTLHGKWAGYRECHIGPDWLLIYKIGNGLAVFVRTGTHSDLF